MSRLSQRRRTIIGFSPWVCLLTLVLALTVPAEESVTKTDWLDWTPLTPLVDTEGLGGPLVGIHADHLIVAGGANFPTATGEDRWDVAKVWHADVRVLPLDGSSEWQTAQPLPQPIAYSAVVSTTFGILCIGGEDANGPLDTVFLLRWDSNNSKLEQVKLPSLPEPNAFGGAATIDGVVYLVGGQTEVGLDSAIAHGWSFDLARHLRGHPQQWQKLPQLNGPTRSFNQVVAQHDGFSLKLYVMGGRRQMEGVEGLAGIETLNDLHVFDPANNSWQRRADAPYGLMAGSAGAVGQSHLFFFNGADGSLIARTLELREKHPGFVRRIQVYHTITDSWTINKAGPVNPVTTAAVPWRNGFILASGETRPRERTPEVWRIEITNTSTDGLGRLDYAVIGFYLLAMVAVGFLFARTNKNTNDYFRGGQRVPWWVAGCSIFATMLSSITFMAIPAKAYAENWVLLLGSFMIPVVAPLAVYLALPFFRRIDATSAYEYLELRFNVAVRLLGSTLFSLFHLFRMGIVLSLAGLALSAFTVLSPAQSVLLMGLLSLLYSTMGGLKAVVWTDTLQTFILLGGALLCFCLVLLRLDGGIGLLIETGVADGKFQFANLDFSSSSFTVLALWVVIFGGIGQNISSYVADQSVVQRYMTTHSQAAAARSIWTNAALVIPGSLLFFGMGTALYVFYKQHPQMLNPTLQTDQIFPHFITTQVPVGLAGLIIAGIFAAAQSTISTSMNSTTTVMVTDFLRRFSVFRSERGYLRAGWVVNALAGGIGTMLGLFFVSPAITSLFDYFLTIIGLFMGVLGGVFLLGMLSRTAHGWGVLTGALLTVATLVVLRETGAVHWMLYAPIGILLCAGLGWLFSRLITVSKKKDCQGLTVHSVF